MRISGLLPVVFLAMAGCGQSRPDCGSSEGQNLVTQIAKDQQALVVFLQLKGSGPDNPDTSGYTDPAVIKLDTELENVKNTISDLQKQCLTLVSEGDEQSKQYCTQSFMSYGHVGNPASDFRDKNLTPLFAKIPELESQIRTLKGKIKDDKFNELLPNIKYSLSNMVMTNKDESTGSVECKATLEADLGDWGTAGQDITYKIEKTTEGKLMATVFGI